MFTGSPTHKTSAILMLSFSSPYGASVSSFVKWRNLIAKFPSSSNIPYGIYDLSLLSREMCVCVCVCAHTRSLVSDSLWPHGLWLPGSSVRENFQARILEQVAISCSRGSSQARDQAHISCTSCIGRWILYHWATGETLRQVKGFISGVPHFK